MPQATDFDYETTVEACARGDAEALRALYERESRWLLSVANRIVRDRHTAHDVLQDAFVQIWQRAGTYQRALGSARGWVYTVVRHKALDEVRRAGRETPAGDLRDALSEQPDETAFDASTLAGDADAAALTRCLDALDTQKRDCIVSAFVEGLTHEQIATRLAAPLGSVKSWIRRGLLAQSLSVMNLQDPEDRSVAAAEYVLGTLDAAARAELEALLPGDAALRAEVYAWQDRLLPLATRGPAAEPDASLWPRIAERIARPPPSALPSSVSAAQSAAPAANDALWRSQRRWRATALLSMAATVALAAVLVLRPPETQVRYITLLQAPETQRTGWVVEATSGERIRLVPIEAGAAVPADKSLQFWTKPQGADRPTSLGLVQPGTRLELPVERSPGLGEEQLFELTLEPQGGSPTGLPTGPILFVGRSVRL